MGRDVRRGAWALCMTRSAPTGRRRRLTRRRFLRLSVAYALPGGSVAAPGGFAAPFRQAWADWSYLRPGDYLAGPEGVAFVAEIEPPKPMLVVMTNAVVSLARPAAPVLAGLNPYGAVTPTYGEGAGAGFPASLLLGGAGTAPGRGCRMM